MNQPIDLRSDTVTRPGAPVQLDVDRAQCARAADVLVALLAAASLTTTFAARER